MLLEKSARADLCNKWYSIPYGREAMTGSRHAPGQRELGGNLRALRLERGWSQAVLADRANVSLSSLQALERGDGSTTTTLARVLEALGVEDWVRRIAPPPPSFNPVDLLRPATTPMQRKRAPRRAPKA